jgi:hypothetical protein
MLLQSGLPIFFWLEAVANANFVRNQSLLTSDNVPPAEKWYRQHFVLLALGATVMFPEKIALKPLCLLTHFLCFFLGYQNKDGQYNRLINESTGRIFYSRSVIFDEERLYKHFHSSPTKNDFELRVEDSQLPEPQTRATSNTRYDLRAGPHVDYSGMEAHAHFIEHTFWDSDISVPQTLKQARDSPDSELWEQAMQDKIFVLTKNNTFTICKLPKGWKSVSCS